MAFRIIVADVMDGLASLPKESVRCVVTSPPYWALRDYGIPQQIGLEATPDEYLDRLVAVFAAVRRVLRRDGTLWLNMGDSYASSGGAGWQGKNGQRSDRRFTPTRENVPRRGARTAVGGLRPKDLVGMPWRLAFALQADGWRLRSDIVWSKPNPMPESVVDRPTRAHEYLFLLARRSRYFYNADAIREPFGTNTHDRGGRDQPAGWEHAGFENGVAARGERTARNNPEVSGWAKGPGSHSAIEHQRPGGARSKTAETPHAGGRRQAPEPGEPGAFHPLGRNKRSVWTISTEPFSDAHFATFPTALVEPCILAGSERGDTVLDPFAGAGTTLLVADRLGREGVGIELNPDYAALATERIRSDAPLFHQTVISRAET